MPPADPGSLPFPVAGFLLGFRSNGGAIHAALSRPAGAVVANFNGIVMEARNTLQVREKFRRRPVESRPVRQESITVAAETIVLR